MVTIGVMVMASPRDGYDIRNVRYEYVHGVDADAFEQLIRGLDLQSGNVVADLMCGYGAVAREVMKYAARQGLKIRTILVDLYAKQLERSCDELEGLESGCSVTRILGDARSCPLRDESVDRVAMKFGLHEVPQTDQQGVVNHCHRVLEPDGYFVVWDTMPICTSEQMVLQDVVRKKDEIAGFDDLVKNRYFFRQDEAEGYLRSAGFRGIKILHETTYKLSTKKHLESDFNGDESKLMSWNEYIRGRVPEYMKASLGFADKGKSIEMTFRAAMLRATK